MKKIAVGLLVLILASPALALWTGWTGDEKPIDLRTSKAITMAISTVRDTGQTVMATDTLLPADLIAGTKYIYSDKNNDYVIPSSPAQGTWRIWMTIYYADSDTESVFEDFIVRAPDSTIYTKAIIWTAIKAGYVDAAISTRGTADPGDAMTLTTGERQAIVDTAQNVADDFKADVTNLDVAISTRAATGAAMTLTTGERQAIIDSAQNVADDFMADVSHLDVAVSTRAATGAAMTLTTGERQAVADSVENRATSFQASGFAEPGDPMTLTTGERQAIIDTAQNVADDFKADVSNLDVAVSTRAATGAAMTLTTDERQAIADTVGNRADDFKATGYAEAGDQMALTAAASAALSSEAEDTFAVHAATYKATGFSVAGDPMTLTETERHAVAESLFNWADDFKADTSASAREVWRQTGAIRLLLASAPDSTRTYGTPGPCDSVRFWYSDSLEVREYTTDGNGIVTDWQRYRRTP